MCKAEEERVMGDIIGELFEEVKMNTKKDDLVPIIVFGGSKSILLVNRFFLRKGLL